MMLHTCIPPLKKKMKWNEIKFRFCCRMSLLGYVVYSKAGFLPTTEVKCDFSTMLPEHDDKKSLLKIVIKSNFFKGEKY